MLVVQFHAPCLLPQVVNQVPKVLKVCRLWLKGNCQRERCYFLHQHTGAQTILPSAQPMMSSESQFISRGHRHMETPTSISAIDSFASPVDNIQAPRSGQSCMNWLLKGSCSLGRLCPSLHTGIDDPDTFKGPVTYGNPAPSYMDSEGPTIVDSFSS